MAAGDGAEPRHRPGAPSPPGGSGRSGGNLVPLAFNLESSVAQQQLMEKVQATVAELPAPQREALELAYSEGLTHTEIAERTREPLGTIKARLRSALQTLKKRLNP